MSPPPCDGGRFSPIFNRPPPPPPPHPLPPTIHHFHHHYNIHLVSESDELITVISEADKLVLQNFWPNLIPFIYENDIFIYNHINLHNEQAEIQQVNVWGTREDHHYVHMLYHHFNQDFDCDDKFNINYFKNHVPPAQHLSSIENQYPTLFHNHTHTCMNFDEEGPIGSSSDEYIEYVNDAEDEDMEDVDDAEDEDNEDVDDDEDEDEEDDDDEDGSSS